MDWIFTHLKKQSDSSKVIFENKEYTYFRLYEKTEELFKQIEHIPNGATTAIVSDYTFESIALFFALYRKNNIIVPITSTIQTEINERIEVAQCDYIVRFINGDLNCKYRKSQISNKHQLVINLKSSSNAGLILFSSGSTGKPKAMIHNLNNLVNSYKGKKGRSFVFIIFLMFDHIGGLNTMLNCLSMGITMVFPSDRSTDHVCELIQRYKVGILPTSPTFLNLILISESYKRFDLSSLRMITYGTEPMPENLLIRLRSIFNRVKFLQTFGTSETGISQVSSKSSNSTFIKLDDQNTEFKIVNKELWIRSKTQILGYLNSSMEKFTQDGWFKTGDLVEEENGYIKIIGRNSEVINVGGEKVLPAEVESVLFQMDQVKDCIVLGENNPITGQMVVAKLLLNKEMKVSEIKKVVNEFCKDKLERYKIPVKIIKMSTSEFSDRFKKKRI